MSEPEADKNAQDTAPLTPRQRWAARKVLRARRERLRRRQRFGLWLLFLVSGSILAGGLLLLSLVGTEVKAPVWLRDRIEQEVNAGLDGMSVEMRDAFFLVEEGGKPRLRLEDVRLKTADGVGLVSLSDVSASVAARPLLKGKVQPGEIILSGLRLTMVRDVTGRFGLYFGDTERFGQSAGSFAQMVEEIDATLQAEDFSALDLIEGQNLTLRFEDARTGRAWNVDGGLIRLTRNGDVLRLFSDVTLLGARSYATRVQGSYTSRIGDIAAEYSVNIEDMPSRDIADQSPAMAWLAPLDAPISGAVRGSIGPEGTVGPLHATLQIAEGVIQPTEDTRPVPFRAARSYFTYDPATYAMRFDELSLESDWISARAAGTAYLVGMEDGWPRELLAQLQATEISANPVDLYPAPVRFDGATMDLRLGLDPFRLTLGQVSLADQGQRLTVEGEVRATKQGWDGTVQGRMDGLTPARLLELWPDELEPKTHTWITENILDGRLSNIQFGLSAREGEKPAILAGFDFQGGRVRFLPTLPPIEGARGRGVLQGDRFSVEATGGKITPRIGGAVDITGTRFIVPDTSIHRGPAEVHIAAKGTITGVLSLLNEKPFELMDKIDRPVSLADGRVAATGRIDFDLKDDLLPEEVAFDVAGTLTSVRSDKLLEGRTLSAARLDLSASSDRIEISGQGFLGQVPFSGTWSSPLSGEQAQGPEVAGGSVTGRIELSERFLDEFDIALASGSVTGQGQGDLTVDLGADGGAFRLTSDLSGLALRIAPINWSLGAAQTGQLTVTGRLGPPVAIDEVRLNAPGLEAVGALDMNGGLLQRARFERVRIGDWFDAPVDLVSRGANRAMGVEVRGGRLDLRSLDLGAGAGGASAGGGGGPLTFALDQLQITDTLALNGFTGALDTSGGVRGDFTGRVNGGTRINGAVSPLNGGTAIRITSTDAGGVLRDGKLLTNGAGGDLTLTLAPTGEKGVYDGVLQASAIRIKDAPAFAELLNAVSVVGLLEQMGGDGILFGEVEAVFRLTPAMLTLRRSSAVGTSMGISMDGFYDLTTKTMDMQGVLSPFYMLNSVGAVISRKGEGLVGFNYTLTGPAAAPRVSVNPLSIFTPGLFRDIFRRPPPE